MPEPVEQDGEDLYAKLARYRPATVISEDLEAIATLHGLSEAIRSEHEDPNYPQSQAAQGLPVADDVTAEDAIAGIDLLPAVRAYLDELEVRFTDAAIQRGENFTTLGKRQGISPQARAKRYHAIGGDRAPSPGRPRYPRPGNDYAEVVAAWRRLDQGTEPYSLADVDRAAGLGSGYAKKALPDYFTKHGLTEDPLASQRREDGKYNPGLFAPAIPDAW